MTREEKAKKIVKETEDFFYHNEQERGLACALRMAKWKDKQFEKAIDTLHIQLSPFLKEITIKAIKMTIKQIYYYE